MRPFRRRCGDRTCSICGTPAETAAGETVPAEREPFRVDLGRLRLDVDHQVTHTYNPRPEPKHVTLECRAVDTNEILGRFPAPFSGYVVRVPRWVLARATEHGADEIDLVVIW